MREEIGHPVVHLELYCGNAARACRFYERLLGWRPEAMRVGEQRYLSLGVAGEVDGGVVETEDERALWLPYVAVASVEEATSRARGLGAAVVLGPREGAAGWRTVIAAPGTGPIALWQQKPRYHDHVVTPTGEFEP